MNAEIITNLAANEGDREKGAHDTVTALAVNDKQDDVAGVFLAKIVGREDAQELLADVSPKEIRALLRKADAIILTLLQFSTMMGAVDKVSVGSAAVLGMRTDTGLVGQQYAWTSAVIYFGAILCILPSLALMQRLPANLYIATMVLMWGVVTAVMAASRNFADLMGIRFLLGCFESIVFAAFGLIISQWYTLDEQPVRTAIVFSTLSSVMNGVLATACVSYSGAVMASWRLLFVLVGLITFAWSIALFVFLPSSPTTAWWLTLRQRVIATRRLSHNHTGMENKTFKLHHVMEGLRDPKTWLIFFINIVLNIPNGGLVTFNSIIVASLGFTIQQTTLLGIPTGLFSWVSSLVFGYLAVKLHQRNYVGMAACLVPFLGVILLYTIPRTNIGGSLASLYLVYFYWGPYIVVMGSMYANTGGYTKKLFVYAVSYVGYCVGNIVGPQTFIADQAPLYTGGVVAMLVCYGMAIVLIFVYRCYLVRLNKQKVLQREAYDRANAGKDASELEEWQDQTDFEHPLFVYQL